MLHLTGYGLTLDDLRDFRQWGSQTPGHPEVHHTTGVEVTTGPLGQGFANAVGMGIAERWLRARFSPDVCDHHTYVICSDGDLMEGISHEAASLAGHLRLGRLVYVYDDNHISIDGETELALSDDVVERFQGYGWHVDQLGEMANDVDGLEAALRARRGRRRGPVAAGAAQPHRVALAQVHRHRRRPRQPAGRGRGANHEGDPGPPARRDVLGPRRRARAVPRRRPTRPRRPRGVGEAAGRVGRRPRGLRGVHPPAWAPRLAGGPAVVDAGRRGRHPQGQRRVPAGGRSTRCPASWAAAPT